jgi:hypothetical protein
MKLSAQPSKPPANPASKYPVAFEHIMRKNHPRAAHRVSRRPQASRPASARHRGSIPASAWKRPAAARENLPLTRVLRSDRKGHAPIASDSAGDVCMKFDREPRSPKENQRQTNPTGSTIQSSHLSQVTPLMIQVKSCDRSKTLRAQIMVIDRKNWAST